MFSITNVLINLIVPYHYFYFNKLYNLSITILSLFLNIQKYPI